LSHCYMFRQYRVILREFVVSTFTKLHKYVNFKLYYQLLYLKYLCNLARY